MRSLRPLIRASLSLALALPLGGCGLWGLGYLLTTGDLPAGRYARFAVTNEDPAATVLSLAFRETPDADPVEVDAVVPPGVADAQVETEWEGGPGSRHVQALLSDGRAVPLGPVEVATDGEPTRLLVTPR